jgi:uncharacterized protein YndB with AHSA1/START domain
MDYVVKKHVTIEASPEEVWQALTDPKFTKNYYFGCEVHSSWKIGSSIRFTRKIFWYTFELKGEIRKIKPMKLLQYTLMKHKFFGKSDSTNYSLVTDELSLLEDGKTILSITDDVGDAPGAEKRYRKSIQGWDNILHGLKQFLEEKK